MSRKTEALESYKNSLRYSIRAAVEGFSEAKVCRGTWICCAPIWELPQGLDPRDVMDLLVDFEFEPGRWERLWFELDYQHLNRMDMTAVYHARCEV